jgi:hypothetical protein
MAQYKRVADVQDMRRQGKLNSWFPMFQPVSMQNIENK